jgi:hypothetical protein
MVSKGGKSGRKTVNQWIVRFIVTCSVVDRELRFEAAHEDELQEESLGVFSVATLFEPGYARQ